MIAATDVVDWGRGRCASRFAPTACDRFTNPSHDARRVIVGWMLLLALVLVVLNRSGR